MTDDLALLQQLRATPDLLAAVATCSPTERVRQKSLRGRFPDELVRAAVGLQEARERAVGRLPHAEQLWLTRTGLEQATAWDVARHKAARFAGCGDVVDLCCGIGSDAAALSHHGQVMAVDRCPAMVMRAAWNTEVLGKPERFTAQCGNVTAEDTPTPIAATAATGRPAGSSTTSLVSIGCRSSSPRPAAARSRWGRRVIFPAGFPAVRSNW